MAKIELSHIRARAQANWDERTELIKEVKKACENPAIEKAIESVDPSFVRKLYNFTGDITTHRICKVFDKISHLI